MHHVLHHNQTGLCQSVFQEIILISTIQTVLFLAKVTFSPFFQPGTAFVQITGLKDAWYFGMKHQLAGAPVKHLVQVLEIGRIRQYIVIQWVGIKISLISLMIHIGVLLVLYNLPITVYSQVRYKTLAIFTFGHLITTVPSGTLKIALVIVKLITHPGVFMPHMRFQLTLRKHCLLIVLDSWA